MGYPLYYTLYGGAPPARAGVRHATVVPYGAYRCGDGTDVLLAVQTETQWRSFCSIVCDCPEWIDDPRFGTVSNRRLNRDVLEPMIEEAFASLTRGEVTERLERADIPYGDLNTVEGFSRHPQLATRNRWRDVGTPGGPMQALLPPFELGDREPVMGDIPAVGEQTDAILTELGFDEHQIAALRESGAL
jgi:crotonobetainyl-CoA:carnitine CoA-transferase CaiB-like acyl-CoA transferase